MLEKHSRRVPAGRAVWYTERLWRLVRGLPVRMVAVADIPELDQVAGSERATSQPAVQSRSTRSVFGMPI